MFDTAINCDEVSNVLAPYNLENLNKSQHEAVIITEGALLVLAGAGTGKTSVLTTRIAHIITLGLAYPSQILAVTFTNKAAAEMRDRVASMTSGEERMPWLGTFHSIALKMLRRHTEASGLKPNFTIIDQDDQIRLVKQLAVDHNIDIEKLPPKAIVSIIQGWKDKALSPDKISGSSGDNIPLKIYKIYQERLKNLNAIDFGDFLLHCINLFMLNPEILAEYHRRFRYILVDEYQDTNVAQYLWLRLLAQGNGNICCVGDDDQSIYGWRGAEVGNILKFEEDFPDAKTIRLEDNYRSTPSILATASALISHNKSRLGKTLRPTGDDGDKVRVVSLWDDKSEAKYIGQEIEALQQTKQHSLGEIAILVRAGFQTRGFEEYFLSAAIPYRVIGGLRFYERREIRDAIAYIRAVFHPSDDLALERIINVPKRGIGATTLERMRDYARENNISLRAAIKRSIEDGTLKARSLSSLERLIGQFERWEKFAEDHDHVETVDTILEESGYLASWQNEKTQEAQGRVENLKELLTALGEFNNIEEFLEHVSLVSDGDSISEMDMVSIMTMHGAKGLEFKTVFLTGWEEGLFPSQRSIDEKGEAGLEEERRLAYVGITRAKRNLTITFAANRRVYGQWLSSLPSRFIEELPEEHIERIKNGGTSYQPQKQKNTSYKAENNSSAFLKPKVKSSGGFQLNQRIFHQKFGYGRVIDINGKHLKISFEKSSARTIMSDYVKAV